MSLSIGIVGLPNVGKSTLFNAITKKQVEAANYPFCTIEPNVGIVKVPDERLEKLAVISKPAKIINTTIEFVDIAGLVKDAHKGEGLGNKFLSHIRECDAICEVVRAFPDPNVIHVNGSIDPSRDKETINLELIFADLDSAEKGFTRTEREAKSGNKEAKALNEVLLKIKTALADGQPARSVELTDDEKKIIKGFNFITAKPIIYALNAEEESENIPWDGEVIVVNAKLEMEIASLPEEEQKDFLHEMGMSENGLDKLIKSSYKLLGLLTFLTTGPEETRAWTVRDGAKAPEAAGVIHTDFEKSFIRAEVINWEKFIEAGGEKGAREKGWIRTEGKDYVVQDGDVCNFLVNC